MVILPALARLARSSIARTMPRTPSSSARRTTGTTSPSGRVDRDADVDVPEDDVRVVEHAGVEAAVLAERVRRRDDDEREHREAHPLGLVALLVRVAQLARLVEVDLGHRHDVRRGELRVGHVVGGDAPAPRERDDLVALGGRYGRHLERAEADARDGRDEAAALVDELRELLRRERGGAEAGWRDGRRRPDAGRTSAPACCAARSTSSRVTRPRSPVPCTAARSTSCSSAALRTVGRGERAERAARVGGRGAPRRRRHRGGQRDGRPGRRGERHARGALLDLRDDGLHRHDLPLGREELGHAPGRGRGQLAVGLVGRDRHERLVLLDDVPLAHEPLRDRPLGDALAELGKGHVDEHGNAVLPGEEVREAYSVASRDRNRGVSSPRCRSETRAHPPRSRLG